MYYETIFIVNPDVSQENTDVLTDALIERVEKASGRIVKREYWGSRPLAYSIAKRKRGHYVLLVTDGEPQAIQALEHAIRLEERIMRFLTTRLTELSDAPSPLMPRKAAPVEETAPEAEGETDAAEKTEANAEVVVADAKVEVAAEVVAADAKVKSASEEASA